MTQLQERYPDDRERSLFASVELSLRRLPAGTRERIRPLGVFQGGGSLTAIAAMLGGLDREAVVGLARQLEEVGLAELIEPGYVRFDPALGPALVRELSETERDTARALWVGVMVALAATLHQLVNKNPRVAHGLVALEVPNLSMALEYLSRSATAEAVVDFATNIEPLLSKLGREKALARVAAIRTAAGEKLGGWSHARCLAESAAVARLIDGGQYGKAVAAARALLELAEAAGEDAYPEAAYDLAMCQMYEGQALSFSGAADQALEWFEEARRRFGCLAETGGEEAAGMASVALTERANCLQDLGRLDEAAASHEEAIRLAEELGDPRGVAVCKGQLGTVRMDQRRYSEALAAYEEARKIFEKLGEPGSIAVAWHQIGMVHSSAGDYETAERAFQESLRIKVQQGKAQGEALTLLELGNLYSRMGRREDAVRFSRQAADMFANIPDLKSEASARNNAADDLVQLERYDEARREVEGAIECKKGFGHPAEPWKTFHTLCKLERATGRANEAAEARRRAIQAYLAYRRDGGENLSGGARNFAVVKQAIASGQTEAASSGLSAMLGRAGFPAQKRPLIPALQAILAGSRDPNLAEDPELDYNDAVEILLLLESLGGSAAGA